ncbi:unnamed protein product [Blepharisma stoltei]|uniref:Transmembrane protein n=1 Tax=Blepharisma stoltei TaxID=1481888 RepID=A0AAU9IMC4_9CILI|nr:unnamed protein product [Blepharisma stoltei]
MSSNFIKISKSIRLPTNSAIQQKIHLLYEFIQNFFFVFIDLIYNFDTINQWNNCLGSLHLLFAFSLIITPNATVKCSNNNKFQILLSFSFYIIFIQLIKLSFA